MDTTEAIDKIKADVAVAKGQGLAVIDVDRLDAYLDDLKKYAGQSTEYAKLHHASSLAHYDAQASLQREHFRTVIDAGKDTLNTVLLINGGAIVILMGFLGAIIAKSEHAGLVHRLTTPLLCFGAGISLTGIGFGVRYLAQFFYATGAFTSLHAKKCRIAGHILNGCTWLLVISALATFLYGVIRTYGAFLAEFPRI